VLHTTRFGEIVAIVVLRTSEDAEFAPIPCFIGPFCDQLQNPLGFLAGTCHNLSHQDLDFSETQAEA
jgi:hypothetical protein